MGTIALPSVAELDLCGMLRPSTYDHAVCVNAAVEINVFDYNVDYNGDVRRRTNVRTGFYSNQCNIIFIFIFAVIKLHALY